MRDREWPVHGTWACPLCEKETPHIHSELIEKGLPMALAIDGFTSTHSVAAILGKMREEYEKAAIASVKKPRKTK